MNISNIIYHKYENETTARSFLYGMSKSEMHAMVSSIVFSSMALYISLLRCLFARLKFHPPTEPVFLMTGMVIGSIYKYVPFEDEYSEAHGRLSDWRLIVLPLLLYKICLFTNFHRNHKIFRQVLSLGIIGLLISAIIIGSALHITEGEFISFEEAFMFGLLCVPIYPAIAIGQHKLFNTSLAQVSSLLEGECLTGTIVAFFLLDVCVRPREGYSEEVSIILIVAHLSAGAVIGLMCGLVLCKLLGKFSDPPIVIIIIFFVPLTSYVFVYFLGLNENLAFVIQVITVCKRRGNLRKDVDQFVIKLVTVASTILTDSVIMFIGIFLAEEFNKEKLPFNLPLILCMYIIVTCGRFFSYALMSVILNKFESGLSLTQMALAIWCGVPSVINIFLGLHVYYYNLSLSSIYGKSIPGNISGLVILGYIINVWTTPLILTRLGLDNSHLARDVSMNICFQQIMDTREILLLTLKLDRLLNDAHWLIVRNATVLTHPNWKMASNTIGEEENFRFAVCNYCNLEFSVAPTYKEYQEMAREARKRVLNAKKNYYIKQHEHGMLSVESCRILIKAIDQGLDMPEVEFRIEPIMKIFDRVSVMEYKHTKLFNTYEYAFSIENSEQMSPCKKKCVSIVVHPAFDFMINMIVICNVTANIAFLATDQKEVHLDIFLGLHVFFSTIYIFEMIIKMFILSSHESCSGVSNYFRCIWNTIDFIYGVLTISVLMIELVGTHRHALLVVANGASIRIVRITRLIKLVKRCQYVATYLTRFYENSVAYRAYETGKTFIKGEQELMLIIPGMVNDSIITEEILSDIEKDVAIITIELGKIQRNLPQVATNFKTKQSIRTILNSMSDEINHIQTSGWIEELEYKLLMRSMYERYQSLRGLTNIEWNSPRTLFEEIPWLKGHPEVTESLYAKVEIKKYAPNESVIVNEELVSGVYIVIVGLLRVEYVPCRYELDQLETYGALPVIDYISDTNFKSPKSDFIVSGNSFGELSILTERPHNCDIIADSPCQLYFINIKDIRSAMKIDDDPINGLECRMWKALCSGLALHILVTASPYRTVPPEEVRIFLDRSFVPNLCNYSRFKKSSFIEDIILIEGAVLDQDSQEYYIAPRHLPRSVRDMALPGNENYALITMIEVKLVIIRKLNANPEVIMDEILLINNEDF